MSDAPKPRIARFGSISDELMSLMSHPESVEFTPRGFSQRLLHARWWVVLGCRQRQKIKAEQTALIDELKVILSQTD